MSKGRPRGLFGRRWHSKVSISVLFRRDMLFAGTPINLVAGFAAFLLFAHNVSAALALPVHLAPVPYNAFLLASGFDRDIHSS